MKIDKLAFQYWGWISKHWLALGKFLKLFTLIGVIVVVKIYGMPTLAFATVQNNHTSVQRSGITLSVVGNQVIYNNQRPYIPEGISIYGGLEDTDYQENIPNVDAQIVAAAKYWHANTIRLQIAESNLFSKVTPGRKYNQHFLRAIIKQVNLARSLNMFVVINDQTEFTSRTTGPTGVTVKFWKIMSMVFKNQPRIIFDLFNEPNIGHNNSHLLKDYLGRRHIHLGFLSKPNRLDRLLRGNSAETWNLWKNGGKFNGTRYIGMQTMVNQIRGYGVNNLIWVEGPNQARELPRRKYLITGGNIVYSFHHPNLNSPSAWGKIGTLSKYAPVVDGEWAQYQSPWAECFTRAYTNAPIYLNYLLRHNIGIIAWSLQAGSLLQDKNHIIPTNLNSPRSPERPSNLKFPSKLFPSYDCGNEFGQGVGQLLQTYFAKNSMRYGG